jgi:putative SOS response-associated peptidase YedK
LGERWEGGLQKDGKAAYKMINARVETLIQWSAFRSLLSRHRCLVPGSGFYQWQQEEKKKKGRCPTIFRNSLALLISSALRSLWSRHA